MRTFFSAGALALLLTGCASSGGGAAWLFGPKNHIEVTQAGDPPRPCFLLSEGYVFRTSAPSAHLIVQVREGGDWRDVWFVVPRKGTRNPKLVRYGELPEGFDEYVRPAALEPGRAYRLLLAHGRLQPSLEFTIREEGGRLVPVRAGE